MLGPLADNGGPTFTHLPQSGSPAIDRGSSGLYVSEGITTDQRGLARTVDDPAITNAALGDATDVGAVEVQNGVPGNVPPTGVNDSYSINQDNELVVPFPGVLANDTDSNVDEVLTAVLVDGPAHSFSFQLKPDGSFDYLASAGFSGTDSFTYEANDGQAYSNVATVTITVNPVTSANHAPTANDDALLVEQPDVQGYLPPPGVLENDSWKCADCRVGECSCERPRLQTLSGRVARL